MTRPTRDDYDAGWFHVFNRGVDRCEVFRDGRDGRHFLALLGALTVEHGVEVHAYCLLGNHFHLLVHAPEGNLSSTMHHIGTVYVRRFNRRHDRDGPLFRSRFRSIAIADERYLDTVGRYIHRNSLDRYPNGRPRDYRWSSMRWYVAVGGAPEWLHTNKLLSFHSSPNAYEDFVGSTAFDSAVDSDWAIGVAIATSDDDDIAKLAHLDRTIATFLNVGVAATRNEGARRKAVDRAQSRLMQHPEIEVIVDVARELIRAGRSPAG